MNDNQGHDIPNVTTLNVTDITNVKHLQLPDNDQRESSGSTPTIINFTYIVTVIMQVEQYQFYNHFLK